MIITDMDPAMAKAISLAFPLTFHGFCMWHILNKFLERLSKIMEKFDAMWKDVINKAILTENEWL